MSRLLRAVKRTVERAGRKALRSTLGESAKSSGPASVRFEGPSGELLAEGAVQAGQTLLRAAVQMGIDLDHYCGGQCSCGTCRVEITSGGKDLSELQSMESMVLGASHTQAGNRLACQAQVNGPVRVRIPQWF